MNGWNPGGVGPWCKCWLFTTQLIDGNILGLTIYNSEIPKEFHLYQNFPNPFNPITKIRFDIPSVRNVKLKVFDILGKEIESLTERLLSPGRYEYTFNAKNFTTGVYFYRIEAGDFVKVKKMVILK